jgi:hypothetical protein
MKDAFERRALLLHLGDALHAIGSALGADARHGTLRELLDADPQLASLEFLAAVSQTMSPDDFATRASAAFAGWPALLLEENVDYTAMALAVRDTLFAGNASGWQAYVAAMKPQVQWFGDALPAVGIEEQGSDPVGRAGKNGAFFPSWPWKPE